MHSRTLTLAVLLAALVMPRAAAADDVIIKNPGQHPRYTLEIEPHLLVGFGKSLGGGTAVGPGVRGTIILVNDGFVSTINNSVGLGVGADLVFAKGHSALLVPVVMQWNFFISRRWSVFGEPGGAIVLGESVKSKVSPVLAGGARLHFSDTFTLTLRAGYPALSVGLSMLF
jgi:hypothetical protein